MEPSASPTNDPTPNIDSPPHFSSEDRSAPIEEKKLSPRVHQPSSQSKALGPHALELLRSFMEPCTDVLKAFINRDDELMRIGGPAAAILLAYGAVASLILMAGNTWPAIVLAVGALGLAMSAAICLIIFSVRNC